MSEIDPDVLPILAACAFDTIEQADWAYGIATIALAKYRMDIVEEASKFAYDAVDRHLWDASIAEKIRLDIVSRFTPPKPSKE